MAAGDKCGWNVQTYAAAPAAWGQDMEVPDSMLYFTRLLSSGVSERTGATGENAAKISTPGGLISGLIISGKIIFGPREEKEATIGAAGSFTLSLLNILARASSVELR
ncbi:hypothetical protein COP2_029130 [Malus domestica]